MKSAMKKKLISTSLAIIMSASTLTGTASSSYAAKVPDYNWATSYPDGILKYSGTSDLTQFVYIKTYKKNSSIPHYKVLQTKSDAKVRLYYDEVYDTYYLDSTSIFNYRYEYDAYGKNDFRNFNDKNVSLSFKPKTGATVGPKYNTYLNGDVNCDHSIDIEDALMVINHIKGKKALNGVEAQFANTYHETNPYVGGSDSTIDIEDAVLIMNYINGETSRL